jgi:uncharacterized membrane protein YfcA
VEVTLERALSLALAGALAGAVNAVAGGGTLLSFPAAVAAGLPPTIANATNSAALAPASLASAYAYRRELAQDRATVRSFALPSALGALAGAALLLVTPERVFAGLVPFLVLFATALLARQNLRRRPAAPAAKTSSAAPGAPAGPTASTTPAGAPSEPPPRAPPLRERLLQALVGLYGGYFGAGIGILMLAILGSLGMRDLHRMNGVKSVQGALINGVAALFLVALGKVDFAAAGLLLVGSLAGGFGGAAVARKVPERAVRWAVVGIGLALTATLGARALSG